MKINKYITYGEPAIGHREIKAVLKVIKTKWIGSGPVTQKFEKKFKKYKKSSYCLALNSCTAGLHLSLMAMNIKHGDEVITTPITFCATANVALYQGAEVKFVDIDPKTLNIDPNLIEEKITEKTKAIMPVDFRGHPANLPKIKEISNLS